ncbi:hypothetical protein KA005_56550, partial [bacterium]|nr:hypothetical protein [bacterium]
MIRLRYLVLISAFLFLQLFACSVSPRMTPHPSPPESVPDELLGDLQIVTLLADTEELSRLHSVDDVQKWLGQFWRRRDPSPSTLENEALEIFRQRARFLRSIYPDTPISEWIEPAKYFLRYGFPISRGAELTNGAPPWRKIVRGVLEQPIPGVIRDRYDFNTPTSFSLVFEGDVLIETRGSLPPSIPPSIQNAWEVLEDPTAA